MRKPMQFIMKFRKKIIAKSQKRWRKKMMKVLEESKEPYLNPDVGDDSDESEEEDTDSSADPKEDGYELFLLPTGQDLDRERSMGPDDYKQCLVRRITNLKEALICTKEWKQEDWPEGTSRSDYVEQLKADVCAHGHYDPFLMEALFKMFPPTEVLELHQAFSRPSRTTIRTNTLKTTREILAGLLRVSEIDTVPVMWSKVALELIDTQGPVPIDETKQYSYGYYMVQSLSSLLPVIALNPTKSMRIVEMNAGHGDKTTYLAALMENKGEIYANAWKLYKPAQLLHANLYRMGVKNTTVYQSNGLELHKFIKNSVNGVLLDAPCSETGVIPKDPSIITSWTERRIKKLVCLQKKLILGAIDLVEVGGVIVYSTCSVLVSENEAVIDYALKQRNVKLVDCRIDFGNKGYVEFDGQEFDSSLQWTRRFFPHAHKMDVLFVAKLQKLSNEKKPDDDEGKKTADVEAKKDDEMMKLTVLDGRSDRLRVPVEVRSKGRKTREKIEESGEKTIQKSG